MDFYLWHTKSELPSDKLHFTVAGDELNVPLAPWQTYSMQTWTFTDFLQAKPYKAVSFTSGVLVARTKTKSLTQAWHQVGTGRSNRQQRDKKCNTNQIAITTVLFCPGLPLCVEWSRPRKQLHKTMLSDQAVYVHSIIMIGMWQMYPLFPILTTCLSLSTYVSRP